jgi:carboxypeptidase Taq
MHSTSVAAATSSAPNYDSLCAHYTRIHRFRHVAAIAGWDEAAFMPPGGAGARAEAMAEMASLLHGLHVDAGVHARLDAADAEDLTPMQRANVREIRRRYVRDTALPDELVRSLQVAGMACEHAWRTQRPANDWGGLAINLRSVVALVREQAERLSQTLSMSRYDALLDGFEPGMTSAVLDHVFGDLRTWLPGLIDRVVAKQAARPVVEPVGPFPVERQRALCERVVRMLGFDLDAGRLDVSTHPFSGGVPEDVRLTTRYAEHEFLGSLMGTIHETGHGRYEQNRPRAWLGQPVSEARSMGIHESQSLSFEMQLGSHPGFVKLLAPLVREAFGDQPAFEPDNLWRLVTRVKRGLIRVDADEVTYPAHVILRYEIERALVEGDLEVDDIPAAWDERMQALLGLDTRGNFADGPMQDVHWPSGAFGYFPCYTLGAMYAAQWFAAMRRSFDVDASLARGELQPVWSWLGANVWSQGSMWPTDELARRASGEALNPAHFRAHLERRYLG